MKNDDNDLTVEKIFWQHCNSNCHMRNWHQF